MAAATAGPLAARELLTTGERLDRRTVPAGALAAGGTLAAAAVPTGIGLRIGDVAWGWTLTWVVGGVLVLTGLVALVEWIRLGCSRFQIGDERVEYVVSLLTTKRTSLPRERIRTVDITANPAQRWLGVADIRMGTGGPAGRHRAQVRRCPEGRDAAPGAAPARTRSSGSRNRSRPAGRVRPARR